MVDEIIADRINNPASFLESLSSSSSSSSGSSGRDRIAEKVVDVVKKLVEFNGLDQ